MKTDTIFHTELIVYRDFYIIKIKFLGDTKYLVHGSNVVFPTLSIAKLHVDDFYTDRIFNQDK